VPFRGRVVALRARLMDHLHVRQADWHGWTLRGAGRLAAAQRIVAERDLPVGRGSAPDCSPEGREAPPPPVIEMNAALPEANVAGPREDTAPAPLTAKAGR